MTTPESPGPAGHQSRPPCQQCGQVHERCTGHRSKNSGGGPCRRWPSHGLEVCDSHGAQLPTVKAAGQRRVAEQEARRAVSLLDPAAPVTDPLSALAELAGEVKRWKDLAAARVDALGDQLRYTAEGVGSEQLRAEVAVYERALDRCDRVLGRIAALNIDDRIARVHEQQAAALVAAVEAGIRAAGLLGEPAERMRTAVAAELRAAS